MNFAITSHQCRLAKSGWMRPLLALDPKAQEISARFAGSAFDTEGSQSQIETYLGAFYRDRGYLEAGSTPPHKQPRSTLRTQFSFLF